MFFVSLEKSKDNKFLIFIFIFLVSLLFLLSWSRQSSDKHLSKPHDGPDLHRCGAREWIRHSGDTGCFFVVSGPVQSTRSIHLVFQQLPDPQQLTAHHPQDSQKSHWQLHLLCPKHPPKHQLQQNHQPDCVLWVWPPIVLTVFVSLMF